jgi:predicted nucleotidyltransferase
MRLLPDQTEAIRRVTRQLAGNDARVWLFGSRLNEGERGGDVDVLIELDQPVDHPALLAASLSAGMSRRLHGRKVDVLIAAPNLVVLPIHEVARREGLLL